MSFSWTCPFCNHKATITGENLSSNTHRFRFGKKYEHQYVKSRVISCPNDDCLEYALSVSVHDSTTNAADMIVEGRAKKVWQLIPQSNAKVFPEYIPKAIIDDYGEACAIKDLSPKASATLSRRCLQGMIRDFWSVKNGRLVDEIEQIKEKVDPVTWAGIDAVRKIGNIGAHMEADINLIIEVEPSEATLLLGLIETLINDWYIVRYERAERMAAIVEVASAKKDAKQPKKDT